MNLFLLCSLPFLSLSFLSPASLFFLCLSFIVLVLSLPPAPSPLHSIFLSFLFTFSLLSFLSISPLPSLSPSNVPITQQDPLQSSPLTLYFKVIFLLFPCVNNTLLPACYYFSFTTIQLVLARA